MRSRNSDSRLLNLDRYGITLNPSSYLVTVSCSKKPRIKEVINELPDWVFTSKHTIWLTDEEKPIADRARKGDEIRREFLAIRNH